MRKMQYAIESRATLFLYFLACLSLGFSIMFFESPWYVLAAAACFLLFVVAMAKTTWALYALLLASLCTAISVEVGPVTVRPDQVVTLIIAAALFLMVISGKHPPVTTNLDLLIIGYLLCNLFSSLLNSPDLRTSLQKCLLLGITFSAYFVSTQLIKSHKVLSNVITLFVVVGVIEGLYSILSVFLLTAGMNIGGAHAAYGDIYARGTFLEGNIFGSYEMIIGLLLLSFLCSDDFRGNKTTIVIGFVIVLVATVMSFTRAAWIGFLLGAFSYVIFLRRDWIFRALNYFPLILTAFLLIAGGGFTVLNTVRKGTTPLFDVYSERFKTIFEYQSGTGSLRLQIWNDSIQLWKQNPILGNGTDSIKVLAVGTLTPMFGEEYWIPNSVLLALHDTGLVGLIFFLAIQFTFLWILWRAWRRTTSGYHRAVLEGFFAAFIGIQFTYLFTNAFWLIFIWVFMAIGISCAKLAPLGPAPETEEGS